MRLWIGLMACLLTLVIQLQGGPAGLLFWGAAVLAVLFVADMIGDAAYRQGARKGVKGLYTLHAEDV